MVWTEEVVQRLRTFWDEGLSAAEIGRRLGTSKHSVIGKAHNLHLPKRPSPIKRSTVVYVRGPSRAVRREAALAATTLPGLMQAVERARPVEEPLRYCCWPIGEPRTQGFRYCDEPSVLGRPYCLAHSAVAYENRRQIEQVETQ